MKKYIIICMLILFMLISVKLFVFAAHPLTTDDTKTVEQNRYELEIGYENTKDIDELRNHSGGISLKHGITERMDIGISFPYQIDPKPTEQFGTTTLGLKFSLIKEFLSITINNELGLKEYFINGIITDEIYSIKIHINCGHQITGEETIAGKDIYSIAFEFPLKKFDIVTESVKKSTSDVTNLIGLRYKFTSVCTINIAFSTNERTALGLHTEF